MEVFADQIEEYQKRHNPIWQELIDVFAEHGVHNYSIFLDETTCMLFGYLEVESEDCFTAIAKTDACRRWWAYMQPLMRYNMDGTPWTRDLREVFHLE